MSKIMDFVRQITVEPILFLFMTASFMQMGLMQDLMYVKLCILNGFDNCTHLGSTNETLIQSERSTWALYTQIAVTIPAIFSSLYLGSWCNYYGVKIPLLLPSIGAIISDAINIYLSTNMNSHVGYLLISQFVSGLFGSSICVIMATFNYLTLVVPLEGRTMRFSILESMILLGGTAGPAISGPLLTATSHAAVFELLLGIHVTVTIYTIIRIHNVRKAETDAVSPSDPAQIIYQHPITFSNVFKVRHCFDTLTVCVRRRTGKTRLYIVLLVFSAFVVMTTTAGELDVTYLFVTDSPLYWGYNEYTMYSALKHFLPGLVLLIGIPLARRYLHPRDTTIVIVAIIDRFCVLVFLAFCTNTAMMFSVPVVGLLYAGVLPAIRSQLSKLTDVNEHGKIFAVVASIEQICFLLGSLIFNGLYATTRHLLHGSIFLLCAFFLIIPLAILSWLHIEFKKSTPQPYVILNEENDDSPTIQT